jgi:hypothetical protein
LLGQSAAAQQSGKGYEPGRRVLMDAHNCYPYFEWWADRIDRALNTGTPLAIEQDLYWYKDPASGRSRSLVAHGEPLEGEEPTMREYFFERVRSRVERALREGNHGDWPIITLNLDLKTEEPEHLHAIWDLLREYQNWLTSAPKSRHITAVAKLDLRPVLVLTGESDAQKKVFYDQVAEGQNLLVFGATPTHQEAPLGAPEMIEPSPGDNYHRWWNNYWGVVEAGGPAKAGEWTPSKENRLRSLVQYAHKQGLWIRFYTLDGVTVPELSSFGWFRNYNFGSREAVTKRWTAAIAAGVDFIASDQYEALSELIKMKSSKAN